MLFSTGIHLLSALTPAAQTLCIQDCFLFAVTLLLLVAFYPAGAQRIFDAFDHFCVLIKTLQNRSSHGKKKGPVRLSKKLPQGGSHESRK